MIFLVIFCLVLAKGTASALIISLFLIIHIFYVVIVVCNSKVLQRVPLRIKIIKDVTFTANIIFELLL